MILGPSERERTHHPIRRLLHQWRTASIRSSSHKLTAAVGLLAVFLMPIIITIMINKPLPVLCNKSAWVDKDVVRFHPDLMHTAERSQRTLHFPFRTGCPQDCKPYRRQLCLSDDIDDAYYSRLTVEWYFGEASKYDPNKSWEEQNGKSNYSHGINFEAPKAFVSTFQAAALELKTQSERLLDDTPSKRYKVHTQKRMHASLSYLCCLTPDEATLGMSVIDSWINETTFNFTLRFTDIQSWHESPNSVTNIVLVDEASQLHMMRLNHDLNRHIEAAGIPVVVPREDQMPFHVTVAGFRNSEAGETFNTTFEIASKLPVVYSLVKNVSNKYRDEWNSHESTFRVLHKPRRSPFPNNHTHPLVEYKPSVRTR